MNTAVNIPLTAVGYPVPVVTKYGTLPAGVHFGEHRDGTGAIDGTPLRGSGGRYLITVFAESSSGTATQCFVLTIDEAPAITSASSTTVATGYAFSFPVTAKNAFGTVTQDFTLTVTTP